ATRSCTDAPAGTTTAFSGAFSTRTGSATSSATSAPFPSVPTITGAFQRYPSTSTASRSADTDLSIQRYGPSSTSAGQSDSRGIGASIDMLSAVSAIVGPAS